MEIGHAVAHVLSELCVRQPGPTVDRAWLAVESVYEDSIHSKKRRGMLWKPIRHLMTKARAHRAQHAQVSVNSGMSIDNDRQWLTGQRSAVAQSAEAFGLDLGDDIMLDQIPDPAGAIGFGFDEVGLLNGPTQEPNFVSPDQMQNTQGSTPDYFSWDGWSPGVGGFSVGGQPAQSFNMNYNKPQEWF